VTVPGWLLGLVDGFNLLVLVYFFLLNTSYLVLTLVAFQSLRRYDLRLESVRIDDFAGSPAHPPITLIVPAYDEEATCVEAVRALLNLDYPSYRILVVNDGSRDETLERLLEAYRMDPASRFPVAEIETAPVRALYRSEIHPELWLIDKENGGKADALNAGLNYCRSPLFCAMDADSLLERNALIRLGRVFMEDGTTVAAGGTIRIANGCRVRAGVVERIALPRSLLARFQVLEYLRAFLSGRMGWDTLGATLIISGAFGIFRRRAVVEVGGFDTDTVGEDMELVVRLHRHHREEGNRYRIGFVPDPVAWTEAPEEVGPLGRQRDRWQRGLVESLTRHLPMLFNPRHGRIGLLAFPYFFFLEMLGPVVEGLGYLSFAFAVASGSASLPYILAFLALAVVFGVALSVTALGLEELTFRRYPSKRDLLHLFWLAILENFGYRQMNSYWRIRGMISKLRKVSAWGEMKRKGFESLPDEASREGPPRRPRGGTSLSEPSPESAPSDAPPGAGRERGEGP